MHAAHLAAPTSVEELSLTGNQPISDMLSRKRKWRREGSPPEGKRGQHAGPAGGEGGAGGDDHVAGGAGAVLYRSPARYSVYLLY